MLSVLTMTYKRSHILEEAIQSFLLQDFQDAEMVVLNDSPDVSYVFDHPRVRVINHPTRFPNLSKKLQYGFTQCQGDWVYRLDDDDLLAPDALKNVSEWVKEGKDIVRACKAFYLLNNDYQGFSDNINNGNVYSKKYLSRVIFSDNSIGEDVEITFKQGAEIFTGQEPTMIYRWGGDTFHISALGVENADKSDYLFNKIEERVKEEGIITLNPHFKLPYWDMINPN